MKTASATGEPRGPSEFEEFVRRIERAATPQELRELETARRRARAELPGLRAEAEANGPTDPDNQEAM